MSSDSARGRCRVFVTRPLPGPALQELAQEHLIRVWDGVGIPTNEDVLKGARRAQGLLCLLTDRVDGHLLDACPGLRVISSCSVGVDHVDLAAACQRGIPVGHTPGVLTETTADLAFGLLLAAARRIPEADRFVREGLWTWERRWEPDLLLGRDLHGSTLGIVGLGAIGQAVARRALGFGMQVLGWSRSEGLTPGVERVSRLEELLGRSRFLSVHVPLTLETRDLIGADQLARLPRGAVLVNTARGGIVDEQALAQALSSGALHAAGLDVFSEEPIPRSSPLLGLPNVVFAPHIGSASVATRERMATLAVENLREGLAGRPMPHCANVEVYTR